MNTQHKCLFHPSNLIVKFCENRQCTLPLCLECEPIHLEEHHSQQSEAKVLRFNEAALKAANSMEDYIEAYKVFEREIENKMENDREIVMKLVEEYYSTARKMINEIKENVTKVTENLNKLNKGSIKSLIFYYSGDVKLNKFDLQFEPLQHKLRNLFQKREQRTQQQKRRPEVSYQANSLSLEYEQKSRNLHPENVMQRQRTREMRNADNQENVFSGIQEIKQERNQLRNRKSIFEQNKKNSGVSTINPTHKQVLREPETKYNYNLPPYEQKSQQMRGASFESNPKFNYDVNYQYKAYEKATPEPEILSFENRFLNKFSCGQQVQKTQQDVSSANQTTRPQLKYDDVFNKKILRPEDLELEKQNSNIGGRTIQVTQTLTQRNRSMSQNHMNEKEIRKTNYDYDLKRQVLSPDEIRKMLQKKIEERNRVLSIKKGDNYQIKEQNGRKGWETRDSIINHIYSEPKY